MSKQLHPPWREVFEAARKDAGVTKLELARRVGMSGPGVVKALREGGNPTLSTMQKFSDALGMDLSFALFVRRSARECVSCGWTPCACDQQ